MNKRFNFFGLALVIMAFITCNALSSAKKPKQAFCFELYKNDSLIIKYKVEQKVDKNLYFAREMLKIDTSQCIKISIDEL